MAEESKRKKPSKIISGAVSFGVKVSKYAKYLANPIVIWIIIIILGLLLVIGVIGFFTALPGSITGWISELTAKVEKDNIITYDVKDKEVLELAKQLEEMGYDVENYGFVDTIERAEALEGNTYLNNTPQKGAIQKVTSKYLTAYLGEEKKMYKIAPENYSITSLTEDYYLIEAIKSLGDKGFLFWGGNAPIKTYYENLDNYEGLHTYEKDLYNQGKALATYYFYYIKGVEIQYLSVEEQELYEKRKRSNIAGSNR